MGNIRHISTCTAPTGWRLRVYALCPMVDVVVEGEKSRHIALGTRSRDLEFQTPSETPHAYAARRGIEIKLGLLVAMGIQHLTAMFFGNN